MSGPAGPLSPGWVGAPQGVPKAPGPRAVSPWGARVGGPLASGPPADPGAEPQGPSPVEFGRLEVPVALVVVVVVVFNIIVLFGPLDSV